MQSISNSRVIFDGKAVAEKIAETLKRENKIVGKKLLILQCDGSTNESTYVKLKRQMGERLGAEIEIVYVSDKEKIIEEIEKGNKGNADGILVQLPIKNSGREETEQILSTIDPAKDIDGSNPKSEFIPAVVMAVEIVLEKSGQGRDYPVALVGAEGQVGKRLYDRLTELSYVVSGFDIGDDLDKLIDFKIIISCVGKESLIQAEMVQQGFVGIDIGYPKADISREAAEKASFITPVPGGVGPLTVVSLFENLAET